MSDLYRELHDAVEELVTAVETLALTPRQAEQIGYALDSEPRVPPGLVDLLNREPAWTIDVHGETADVITVENAADRINERLEH